MAHHPQEFICLLPAAGITRGYHCDWYFYVNSGVHIWVQVLMCQTIYGLSCLAQPHRMLPLDLMCFILLVLGVEPEVSCVGTNYHMRCILGYFLFFKLGLKCY